MKTRLWKDASGSSSTMVQFRTDTHPMLWMHTNIGWIPDGSCPDEAKEAEAKAEEVAKGYGLDEVSQEEALYWAGK